MQLSLLTIFFFFFYIACKLFGQLPRSKTTVAEYSYEHEAMQIMPVSNLSLTAFSMSTLQFLQGPVGRLIDLSILTTFKFHVVM